MNALINKSKRGAMFVRACLLLLLGMNQLASAQSNSIESVEANQQGSNIIVRVAMKKPLTKLPTGFSIANPARIALDFAEVANGTGKTSIDINTGDLRTVTLVEATGRSRMIFNLNKPLNYAAVIEGKMLIVTIDGSGGLATPTNSQGLPVNVDAPVMSTKPMLHDIDFRRGVGGEGRIVVDLPLNQVAVDVRQQGQKIYVTFLKAGLPDVLRRRLDVADFGSPVQTVTTTPSGENVQMVIEPKGLWEQSSYQSDTQFVLEVKPIKEDPNKLTQGTQGYRGERLSFNFQNIEVRAILQIIAEVSGLNVIASDTVTGTITLRLKDVPWDQALDNIMQIKGLDMRKNGNVIWVAPKDELLTKEKLELEQKAQIADLEPLKTESFQLNYQKAEAFKLVFGADGTTTNRLLSKRGSAVIEPRTNQLFITDIPSKIEEVRKLIQKTDIASKQVMIEARIVEADDTFSKNLGAKLGFTDLRGINGGTTGYQVNGNQSVAITGSMQGVAEQTLQTGVTSSTLANSQFVNLPAAAIGGLNPGSLAVSLFSSAANRFLNLELSALEADGKGKVISSPRVVTADQLKALIEQGTELPYQVATASGATSIAFRKATMRLEVTPQITPDGNIVLDVEVHKDSVGQQTSSGLAIDTKEVKTMVLVENGGTVVLGGIYQQTENDSVTKIPFFGDLPLLGNLFKTTGKSNQKTELLIFITPKIMTDRLGLK
ncbi:type IV pilus secretin PilQ [Undibacterium sp. RuRC25W]|uniref:type IV pilus secretin PilQ n=1 Tax=Undibacterium sp. RuRC25W TaxID=3413047 RepID=UPI003BEFC9F7